MCGGGLAEKPVHFVSLCWNVPLHRDICAMKCSSLLPTTMKLLPLSGCNHCYCAISTRTDTLPEETTTGFLSVACRWQLSVEILGNSGNFLRPDGPIFRSLVLFRHFACKFSIIFFYQGKTSQIRMLSWVHLHLLHPSIALDYCLCFETYVRTLKDGFFFSRQKVISGAT